MKISKLFIRKSAAIAALGLLALHSASSYAARCEYIIQSEWSTGFVAAVRITNDTSTVINSWSVNWAYSDGTSRTGGWNANFSGSNPYTATGVGWNDRINPGQAVEFGVQGNKGVANSPAQRPSIGGVVCAGLFSSANSKSSANSSVSSSRLSTSSYAYASTSKPTFSSAASSTLSASAVSSSSFVFASFSSRSSSLSSSSSSLGPNIEPVANLQVTTTAATVYVDGRNSTDADGNTLTYNIDFGDGQIINYPHAWHSYLTAGDYTITLKVSDGRATTTTTKLVNVQPSLTNQPPIAMLATIRQGNAIIANATASLDPEGTPLTYEWDLGDGIFTGDAITSVTDCAPGQQANLLRTITITVSDGELKDTRQAIGGGLCGFPYEVLPVPQFTYRVEGNQLFVDARATQNAINLHWNFGDDTASTTGVLASHTYAAPGTYFVNLYAEGLSQFGRDKTQSIQIGSVESSAPSSWRSSSSALSSSALSSSKPSSSSLPRSSSPLFSSSIRSSSSVSSTSSNRNHYDAHRATTAPIIDGTLDAVWEVAAWAPIDVFWLGTQPNPTAQDYSGRYKAIWDENYLYLIFDITDDRLFDGTRNALDRYWEDDTVELFIDENKNGGQHSYNTSAWAYHISTYGDVVDYTTSGPNLLNDHIDMRLVSMGDRHRWEMRVRIYGEDYADWKTNVPLKLAVGKLMGFSASYIDNDGGAQRESMMGSVDTQGHKNNQGYLDASVFGSLKLVE